MLPLTPRSSFAALALSLSALSGTEAKNLTCSASSIPYPTVFGANITSLTAAPVTSFGGAPINVCEVNVTLTHPGTNDMVHNTVWLPMTNWNGRFQGTGGGGYLAGEGPYALYGAIASNYSAATTDAGHDDSLTDDASANATSWALISEGNVNQYLLLDFASRSIHDMTVIGKAVTASFYGTPANKSYWNGCSTGGRQGLAEAQMYPEDYDGILAEAPAVNWNPFTLAQQWPYVVLLNEPGTPYECDFAFVNAQALAFCDPLDGLVDGLIAAPGLCLEEFSPMTLVNKTFYCADTNATRKFPYTSAAIVQKIWNGPVDIYGNSLWYGILPGTNFTSLAPVKATSSGAVPLPFGIADSWVSNFLYKIANYDTSNITYTEYNRLFNQSQNEYDSVMGTMNPNLSAFKARGGKLITWQGLADNYIIPNGTMNYYNRVDLATHDIQDFYRLFFSPGVGHCGGGYGPYPVDALGAVVAWVEQGIAPATLLAASPYPVNGTERYQALCPYPQVSKYKGSGDPFVASAYECVASF